MQLACHWSLMCHPDFHPLSPGRTVPAAFVSVEGRTKQDGLANPLLVVRWEAEIQPCGLLASRGQEVHSVQSQPGMAPTTDS